MRQAAQSIAASVAVHAVLAAALAVCAFLDPAPDSTAAIDVSAVELSISDSDAESPPAAQPSPPASPRVPTQRIEMSLPEAPQTAECPPAPPCAEVSPLPLDPSSLAVEPPEGAVAQVSEADAPRQECTDAPQQARIDAPPRPVRTIRPVYPRGARRRGEQGDVALDIRVGETGEVDGVDVASSSGFADLDAAAAAAVRAAKFEPARSGGLCIASTARLRLSFRLR